MLLSPLHHLTAYLLDSSCLIFIISTMMLFYDLLTPHCFKWYRGRHQLMERCCCYWAWGKVENLLCIAILGLYYDFSTKKIEKNKIRIRRYESALWRMYSRKRILHLQNPFFLKNKQRITISSTRNFQTNAHFFALSCSRGLPWCLFASWYLQKNTYLRIFVYFSTTYLYIHLLKTAIFSSIINFNNKFS